MATTVEDAHGPTENWNKALYHDNFMENSCSLCHGEYLQAQAPVLFRGQTMFFEYVLGLPQSRWESANRDRTAA